MYKCRTYFHCNSVSFLPDCPTCSEFETLWQTVQDLKEQVANNKMQYIVIVRILAKYRNPSVISKKKRYITIYHLSVDLWTIGLSSVSRSKHFETLKGLEFNKCILF